MGKSLLVRMDIFNKLETASLSPWFIPTVHIPVSGQAPPIESMSLGCLMEEKVYHLLGKR